MKPVDKPIGGQPEGIFRVDLEEARHPVEIAGGLLIVAGAAVTAMQSEDFGTVFGLLTAVALLAVGTMPDRVLLSLAGSLGLLVNVPWSINHFFPGEGRAPLLILVSGVVIVAVAVLLYFLVAKTRNLVLRLICFVLGRLPCLWIAVAKGNLCNELVSFGVENILVLLHHPEERTVDDLH